MTGTDEQGLQPTSTCTSDVRGTDEPLQGARPPSISLAHETYEQGYKGHSPLVHISPMNLTNGHSLLVHAPLTSAGLTNNFKGHATLVSLSPINLTNKGHRPLVHISPMKLTNGHSLLVHAPLTSAGLTNNFKGHATLVCLSPIKLTNKGHRPLVHISPKKLTNGHSLLVPFSPAGLMINYHKLLTSLPVTTLEVSTFATHSLTVLEIHISPVMIIIQASLLRLYQFIMVTLVLGAFPNIY